ncbi:MAG: hypothetical protein PXY39_10300 [archaeon]|nr:hypothetical protein [archaeon]
MARDTKTDELLKSLELTKEQVHNLNLRKMDPNRIKTERDIAEEDEMGRNYPILEARSTAKAALDNCSKLTSFISAVNAEEGRRMEDRVGHAMDALVSANSPSKLDSWYREELSPLLTVVERIGKDALQSSGESKYHPRGRKPRSGLSIEKS